MTDTVRSPENPILIIDDEEQTLRSVRLVLKTQGLNNIVTESDSRNVLDLLEKNPTFSVILMDLSMPHMTGHELMAKVKALYSWIPVIVVTGSNNLETAVRCMREGAFDYVVKPVDKNRLYSSIQRALEFGELQQVNAMLKKHMFSNELEQPEAFDRIITQDKGIFQIFKYLESISRTAQPVLITGETGVGKELFARAIHALSGRKGRFVPVNIAGLDEHMISDTLFGHTKGAFTGAMGQRKGLVETAENGTLFLDEIGDMPLSSQVKLLRLLQEKEFYPVGSDTPSRSEARIVVATNQHLQEMINQDKFRSDLYYRLQTHHVMIPPLRERKGDIPPLVKFFSDKACQDLDKGELAIPQELYVLLRTYHFPGNVRELESLIFDAVSKCSGNTLPLTVFRKRLYGDLDSKDFDLQRVLEEEKPLVAFGEQLPTLKETSWLLIREAMERADNNQSIASRMLGVTQQALSKRLKSLDEETSKLVRRS